MTLFDVELMSTTLGARSVSNREVLSFGDPFASFFRFPVPSASLQLNTTLDCSIPKPPLHQNRATPADSFPPFFRDAAGENSGSPASIADGRIMTMPPRTPSIHFLSLFLSLTLLSLSLAHVKPSPPLRSERKIALLHMHDGAPFFTKLGSITLSNKVRYAARHGYEIVSHTPEGTDGLWKRTPSFSPPCNGSLQRAGDCYQPANDEFEIDKRAATFGKIKLALAACVGREGYWLLWSDADALIVNQSVLLEAVIDDAYDILVSVDWLMINAGVMLMKCSPWTRAFLQRVYTAREFDSARALDQSALQHFFDTEEDTKAHVKYVPKHAINVYIEEYRPGDFLLHMAGKLYEATTEGAIALAQQFDVLSMVDEQEDVDSFFRSQYVLNKYSGICADKDTPDSECKPTDERRLRLKEPLGYMSMPKRYRHVALRYYWMPDWTDKYDTPGWNEDRKVFDGRTVGMTCERESKCRKDDAHDEL